MENNRIFLEKAEALTPRLNARRVKVGGSEHALNKGDRLRLDFGEHLVGYLTLSLSSTGSHPDAPAWLRVRFAEREQEFSESLDDYTGWISSSWVQQEDIRVDILPRDVRLPRRYAFRFVEIEIIDLSRKYSLIIESAECEAFTSADEAAAPECSFGDERLALLDKIARNTLRDCMQSVFEDGPKRDRRLWMGDLRLQALANYETYKNYDLVKRCLYLFAGSTMPGGRVGAAVFTEPEYEVDDTEMLDYSLLFIPTVLDYYNATGDKDFLGELWGTAKRQIEIAQTFFDENGLIRDSAEPDWCFIDWSESLNKQASAQGVYLYALRAANKIAEILGDSEFVSFAEADYETKKASAIKYLYDEKSGLFVSGSGRQISWASQVWMVLAGAADGGVLRRAKSADAVKMVTPYMYHHYVDALIACGEREEALSVLKAYWGGMADLGADTFWELYDPEDPNASPYGGTIVLSYCHAWSCAPAYFLRKYFGNTETA